MKCSSQYPVASLGARAIGLGGLEFEAQRLEFTGNWLLATALIDL
jgi:hypothetical protein